MKNKHPAMLVLEALPHLKAGTTRLEVMVGKRVRFKGVKKSDGLIHKHGVFEVVGVQRNYRKELCLRVACVEYKGKPCEDDIGAVMPLDRVEEVS